MLRRSIIIVAKNACPDGIFEPLCAIAVVYQFHPKKTWTFGIVRP